MQRRDQTRRRGGALGTWLARGAELVVLGRYGDSTIVYLPSQDMFYYASPCCLAVFAVGVVPR